VDFDLLGTFINTFADKLFECTLKMQTSKVCVVLLMFVVVLLVLSFLQHIGIVKLQRCFILMQ
jgi:hypothetical protein